MKPEPHWNITLDEADALLKSRGDDMAEYSVVCALVDDLCQQYGLNSGKAFSVGCFAAALAFACWSRGLHNEAKQEPKEAGV